MPLIKQNQQSTTYLIITLGIIYHCEIIGLSFGQILGQRDTNASSGSLPIPHSKAGVVCLQVKLCDPHPSALEVRFSRPALYKSTFTLYFLGLEHFSMNPSTL